MADEATRTTEEVEAEIAQAMRAIAADFMKQAETLTPEGVRRALETDLGMEKFSLDVSKKFIKQCLNECILGAEDETASSIVEKATEQAAQPKQKEILTEHGDISEDTIRSAMKERASYIRANVEELTPVELRRLLERDLKLENKTLDPYKKFIKEELDQVLSELQEAVETVNGIKNKQKKGIQSKGTKKISAPSKSPSTDSESLESDDVLSGDEEINEQRKSKKRPGQKKEASTKSLERQKKSMEGIKSSARKKKPVDDDTDKSSDEGGNASDSSHSRSSTDERVKKKTGKPTQTYGKQVEHLRSIIKSCGMGITPAVYKRAKQVPESKREAVLIKELEEILKKEGLSTNPSEKDSASREDPSLCATHIVTQPYQLPDELLNPSMDREQVIGFDCKGVDHFRHGAISLLQFAFPHVVYLVDVIQGGQKLVQACKPALESRSITKVVHDCRWLSEALYFQFGVKLHNVMDTQIAYSLIVAQQGSHPDENVSLVDLRADPRYCGTSDAEKDGSHVLLMKDSNIWSSRPMSELMVHMAADDARFLLSIYHKMTEELNINSCVHLAFRGALHCRWFCITKNDFADWAALPRLPDADIEHAIIELSKVYDVLCCSMDSEEASLRVIKLSELWVQSQKNGTCLWAGLCLPESYAAADTMVTKMEKDGSVVGADYHKQKIYHITTDILMLGSGLEQMIFKSLGILRDIAKELESKEVSKGKRVSKGKNQEDMKKKANVDLKELVGRFGKGEKMTSFMRKINAIGQLKVTSYVSHSASLLLISKNPDGNPGVCLVKMDFENERIRESFSWAEGAGHGYDVAKLTLSQLTKESKEQEVIEVVKDAFRKAAEAIVDTGTGGSVIILKGTKDSDWELLAHDDL